MAVTVDLVRGLLAPDEVDYVRAARLGPDALPHLESLVEGGELHLAAKAAYLAGLIQHDRSAEVLSKAALSPHGPVRLAAAATARNLSRPAMLRVLRELVGDLDHFVRRGALRSVTFDPTPELRAPRRHQQGGRTPGHTRPRHSETVQARPALTRRRPTC